MADEDAKKWLSCLGWGCLAVVVVSALGIGGCVAFFYKGGSGAHEAASAYLEAVEVGDFEAAFPLLGPGFTESRSLDEFVAFEEAVQSGMDACGDWRMSGTSFNRESGRSLALLTFHRLCGQGSINAAFSLEQVDGEWVIQDIRYNEPVAPVVRICAECSTVVPPQANFCPACGARVGTDRSLEGSAETSQEHPRTDVVESTDSESEP